MSSCRDVEPQLGLSARATPEARPLGAGRVLVAHSGQADRFLNAAQGKSERLLQLDPSVAVGPAKFNEIAAADLPDDLSAALPHAALVHLACHLDVTFPGPRDSKLNLRPAGLDPRIRSHPTYAPVLTQF